MGKLYFGFGMADNMFPVACSAIRKELTPAEAKELLSKTEAEGNLCVCLNPSHAATIAVMQQRYLINVPIPVKAPIAKLNHFDGLLVMSVSGLPRLEGRHEYTQEEVAKATFKFALWTITP
jgi:hypothetical protein